MGARNGLLSLAVLALAAAPNAWAEPPKLEIKAELTPKNGFVIYTPPADVVSIKYKSLSGLVPFPAEILKDARSLVISTEGKAKGRYKFYAVGANAKGEQADADFEIVIGDAPKPPPTPPQPEPPAPDLSPLAKKLAEAYATETAADRRERLVALCEVFAGAVTMIDSTGYTTVGEFSEGVTKLRKDKVGDSLLAVRKAIGVHLNTELGDGSGVDNAALTAEVRAKYKKAYTAVSAALKELK